MGTEYERGYQAGYHAGIRKTSPNPRSRGRFSHTTHNWKLSDDQSETGTSGVRKYCSEGREVLTFFDPELHSRLTRTEAQS